MQSTIVWVKDIREHAPRFHSRAEHARHIPHYGYSLLLHHYVLPGEGRAKQRLHFHTRRVLVVHVG